MLSKANTVLPATSTYLGFVRDEETLEAKMYLNKLPKQFDGKVPSAIPCSPRGHHRAGHR